MQNVHIDQLDDLDPERDLRTDRGDLHGLAHSLIEEGVLTPLTVIPGEGGRFTIYAGHRRRAALRLAAELLTGDPGEFDLTAEQAQARAETLTSEVPCYVRADLAGRDTLAQLAENGERKSLAPAERMRGLQLAISDGYDDRTISRAGGFKTGDVRAARRLDAMPEAARTAVDTGQLDLDQLGELAEFADDEKAVKRILRSSGSQVRFAIAEERQKRQRGEAAEKLKAEATVAGHKVVRKPQDLGYTSREEQFGYLAHPDGTTLTPETDAHTDGHVVFVDTGHYAAPNLVHMCQVPDEHGHTRLRHTSYRSPAEIAAREAEDRAREERRIKMDAAREVRAKFLRTLIGSQKAAAKHTDLLTTIAARWPRQLCDGERHRFAATLLPAEPDTWTPARAQQHAVARAILGADKAAEETHGWCDYPAMLWWWDTLTSLGYERGEAEDHHVAQLQRGREEEERQRAEDAAEDAAAQAAEDAAAETAEIADHLAHDENGQPEPQTEPTDDEQTVEIDTGVDGQDAEQNGDEQNGDEQNGDQDTTAAEAAA
ncbi:ParB-like chromosome segregation protein Spo0J [Pseudonocardia sediminis]|uniref:ParB-like chromosome segregation protein Spo0J n=1 Tax=Pseudonocardia sediminis TaxID=1397368 RepID=A0A4V6ME03_PSEST|nr:ParB N-terminal domain-containing protein [Pseudonocardia sediminis]RZT75522.1 ParB-like chromosome segregation protein Spo0J [Pseudonocardia sediminis]